MDGLVKWLAIMGLIAGFLALFGWLGHTVGTRAARKYPSLAMALHLINAMFRFDPPPPPTMETIRDGEEQKGAGDPPST